MKFDSFFTKTQYVNMYITYFETNHKNELIYIFHTLKVKHIITKCYLIQRIGLLLHLYLWSEFIPSL